VMDALRIAGETAWVIGKVSISVPLEFWLTISTNPSLMRPARVGNRPTSCLRLTSRLVDYERFNGDFTKLV
jgi:hypothetical protein